ncbi:IclR family transcriptional regulator [Verticiella sediminum]|uniref:IclR family transcriptional regulator n=1 Tax=Verticiella sediminum TaxID=1247510 RepID=A0A556ALT7_9BURK|nr:IclR family transcriptional regulator [Verticiella sediminum]TSH93848.1 IclR family transcriptional regulator [Verticiella sediminum]
MVRKRAGTIVSVSLEDAAAPAAPGFARTLAKGLEVLRCFTPRDRYLGNGEIARRVGLPPQTVSRLTYTLVALGYLAYSSRYAKYRLANGVLAIAYPMLGGLIVRQSLRPLLAELAREFGGSVSLGTRHRDSMIYLESFNAPGSANAVAEMGSLIPIASTAMGRAWLAVARPEERAPLLARLAGSPAAARRLDQQAGADADALRTQGYCYSSGQASGRTAVAVPLAGAVDGERLVVNCGMPRATTAEARMRDEIGPRLAQALRGFEAVVGLNASGGPAAGPARR